jgi:2-iminoacetate synthase ThiH
MIVDVEISDAAMDTGLTSAVVMVVMSIEDEEDVARELLEVDDRPIAS